MKRSSILLAVFLLAAGFAFAQLPQVGHVGSVNLTPSGLPFVSSVLDKNGSVRRGVSGSFNPRGFRIVPGKEGAPRFVADSRQNALSTPTNCSDGWDDQFWTNGINGTVYAVAVDGPGNLYVGGDFSTAGNVVAVNIAKWDGSSWSALGSGVSGAPEYFPNVTSIAISGTDIYVGGSFTRAGELTANRIAKWNGSNWSTLGSGVEYFPPGPLPDFSMASVGAIEVSGTEIYVGGHFTKAGGEAANNIAKWNGTSWSALGSGTSGSGTVFDGSVGAIAISGTDIYVGGGFGMAGDVVAIGIAKWNGTSWSALGPGVNGVVVDIAISGTDVYVVGTFWSVFGVSGTKGIAKWDGSSWSALGSGANGNVSAVAVSGTNVYASGNFTTADGLVTQFAKWDGSKWSAVGSGVGGVNSIAVSGTDIYVGGKFTSAGGTSANDVAKWNGSTWSALGQTGSGLDGDVSAIAISGNDIYVGGDFSTAGGITVNHIAKWNGSTWSPLGSGVSIQYADSTVDAIAISGTDVYVGGYFATASGIPGTQNIARWDGKNWSALGSGVNHGVHAIAVLGTDVYVGGSFASASGVVANGIAKWNGSNWSALGSGVSAENPYYYPSVDAIVTSGNDVYVGGNFTSAGGVPSTQGIAEWNGSNWSPLGSGIVVPVYSIEGSLVVGGVYTIAISNANLYAGGLFSTAGGIAAHDIAKWDGSNWAALESGVSGGYFLNEVRAIATSGTGIYVGGMFTSAGSASSNHIAKWNGSDWSALASGANSWVSALAVSGPDLFAGGNFSTAGCHAASSFSRYKLPKKTGFDFDGDGKSDVSIFRSAAVAEWWVLESSDDGHFVSQFGASGDVMTPADFTGDGKTDIAVFRSSTGEWFVLRSEDGSYFALPFGLNGDIAMPADYDGDGKADVAVFRPSSGTWFILRSSDQQVSIGQFGSAGDMPVASDYDGDGKADVAIFRPNGANGAEWWVQRSSDQSYFALQFGSSTDKAVPGDYTGDGKTDIAFWRESTGQWFILRSEDFSYYAFVFGLPGDMPAPGDFDGDGVMDPGVFRQPGSQWWVNKSSGGTMITSFGTEGDEPVHCAYVR